MRLKIGVLLTVFILRSVPVKSETLPLIPQPRFMEQTEEVFTLSSTLSLSVPDETAPDYQNTVQLLRDRLDEITGSASSLHITHDSSAQDGIVLRLIGQSSVSDDLLHQFPPDQQPPNEEGYCLLVQPHTAVLAGKSAAGLFYAAQTFLQLVQQSKDGGSFFVPGVKISDWPESAIRGVMIDSSQGMIPNLDTVKRMIQTMAEYKLNRYYLYSEDTLEYPQHPLVGEPGGRYSPDDLREIVSWGERHYVEVVPCVQFHGHMHNILRLETYSDLAEIPHGGELSPGIEGVDEFIEKCVKYLVDIFPSKSMHVGGDETYELGTGRSREHFPDKTSGEIYLAHAQHVQNIVREQGRTPEVWGDIVLNHPEIIPQLSKNLRIMSWSYFERDDFTPLVKPFADAHLPFVVCPGVRNWMQIYPNFEGMRSVIRQFLPTGRRYGTDGILNTLWIDTCEEQYSLNYYGFAFGAAAGWSPDIPDTETFDRAFAWTFHRDNTGEIMKVYSEMLQAQLIAESFPSRSSIRLSWMDPFEEANQIAIATWEPKLREMRLHAEHAMEEIYRSRQRPLRNLDVLDFIEYAARRIDLTGLKLQYGPEMSRIYRAAMDSGDDQKIRLAAIQLGASTKANKCRIYDLIYMTGNLKDTYRGLWLRDNKPYNMEGTLALWDREIQHFWDIHAAINRAWEEYRNTKELPPPESLGFYVE